MEIHEASVSLVVRAMVVSARWAARSRGLSLERACARGEAGRVAQLEARVVLLEDAVAFRDARLEVFERRLGEERPRRPYPLLDRLRLLWLIEYYQIPKRRAKDTYSWHDRCPPVGQGIPDPPLTAPAASGRVRSYGGLPIYEQ